MCSKNADAGINTNSSAKRCWPNDDAREAYLLRPSAATNGRKGGADDGGIGQDSYCRLNYDDKSGRLQLVTCPAPPPSADQPMMQGGNADPANSTTQNASFDSQILDVMDVADIIGAELEVRFLDGDGKVTTAHGWTGSVSSTNRNPMLSDLDALDVDVTETNKEEKVVGDVGAGSGCVSGRTSPVADDVGGDCGTNENDAEPPILLASDLSAALNKIKLPAQPSEGEVPVHPRRDNRNQAVAYLNIFCYPRPEKGRCGLLDKMFGSGGKSGSDDATKDDGGAAPTNPDPTKHLAHRQAQHRRWEVAPTEDFAAVRAVVRAIRALANGDADTTNTDADQPRRYLVVVNPYSGTGQGESIYNNTVKPMLEQAGIDHDVCITERSGHAMDRMGQITSSDDGNNDISTYDALIAMGGDGILWEMLQGIRARQDADEVLQKLVIGIVGCGTSNGLAKSILHQSMEKYSPLEYMQGSDGTSRFIAI